MLIIDSIPWIIVLMVCGMLLLGTWPALWNKVERHGRLPSHTFLDYTAAYLCVALVTSFSLGQIGPPHNGRPNFLDQLTQPNGPLVGFAVAGGVCLALGDVAMQYAVALLGLSVGPPILNAMTIVVGTVLSYFLDGGINKPYLVFPGMGAAAVAISLGSMAHLTSPATKQQRLRRAQSKELEKQQQTHRQQPRRRRPDASLPSSRPGCFQEDGEYAGRLRPSSKPHVEPAPDCAMTVQDDDACSTTGAPLSAPHRHPVPEAGISIGSPLHSRHQQQHQQQNHHQQQQQHQQRTDSSKLLLEDDAPDRSIRQKADGSIFLGLVIAVVGGTIYSLFLPCFQIAANDIFHLLPSDVPPLSIYTANFYFTLGFAATSALVNALFLYRPPLGTKSSSFSSYLSDHTGRGYSLLSGMLAACGDLTQFMGGQVAGYAAAMLVMAYPIVGVLWGMLHFKEHKSSSRGSFVLLVGQVVCYAASVGLMAGSAQLRTAAHGSS